MLRARVVLFKALGISSASFQVCPLTTILEVLICFSLLGSVHVCKCVSAGTGTATITYTHNCSGFAKHPPPGVDGGDAYEERIALDTKGHRR